MKRILIWIAIGSVCLCGVVAIWFYTFASNGFTSAAFQHDADIVRLRDMQTMGALLKEYQAKMGKLPLQGESELQYYVLIGDDSQVDPDIEGPAYKHDSMSTAEFEALLSEDLERPVKLPYDPQLVSNGKPTFYLYMMDGDRFYFAIHLHESYGIAKEVGPFYYKLEISNNPEPPEFWDFDMLMANESYQAASSKALKKPGFFDSLEHRRE